MTIIAKNSQVTSCTMNKFGQFIREKREENGLYLRHVAAKIDIYTPLMSKIERGERKIKREQIKSLANTLNVKENELLELWLLDKVIKVIENEVVAVDVLKMALEDLQIKQQQIGNDLA